MNSQTFNRVFAAALRTASRLVSVSIDKNESSREGSCLHALPFINELMLLGGDLQ